MLGSAHQYPAFFLWVRDLDLHVAGCLASRLQKCASRHGTEVSAVLLGGELLHPALRLSTCAGGYWFSAAGKEKGQLCLEMLRVLHKEASWTPLSSSAAWLQGRCRRGHW